MMPLLANPFFLWLMPLAALPVIFHLFFKVKKRPRPFSTLMFFQRIDPRLSARKQIREWLILTLRTLLILLALLALARPRWFAGFGGGSVSVVIVLDNSGSMTGPKLKTATAAANALLAGLDRADTAGIVLLVDDPTVSLPATLTADRAALKSGLNRVAETEATGAVGDALRRAFAMLENSSATRAEVHVFTDLQEAKWGRAAGEMPPLRAGATLTIHRIASAEPKEPNVALTSVELPQKRLLAGRNLPIRVTLKNATALDARVRLNLADDTGNKSSQEIFLTKNEEKPFTVMLATEVSGFHWFNVWIEGDTFTADNRASVGYVCAEKSIVLFAGAPGDFGVLPVALAPAAEGRLSGLIPAFTPPDSLDKAIEEKKPLLVVLPSSVAVPQSFVARGGNVLVLPGLAGSQTKEGGAPVLVFQKNAPVFNDLRDDKGDVALRNVRALRFVPVTGGTALLGLEDGRALLTEERVGRGRVFRSGLAFDPSWSTLPLKGGFLALAQSMALIGDDSGGEVTRLIAGQHLAAPAGNAPLHIRSVAGSPLDWKGPAANAPAFPRAGVYVIERDGRTSYVSVRASDLEGRAAFLTGNQVPALAGLKHTVRKYTTPDALLKEFRVVSRGVDLYVPLLLAALLALLVEGWLANQPPHKVAAPPAR